jgi:hypothetical protein
MRLGPPGDGQHCGPDQPHHGDEHVALPDVADYPAEGAGQTDRDDQQQEDLEQVGPGVRVLERVRGVAVEDPAAVGAQLLDHFLAGGRGQRDGARVAVQPSDGDPGAQAHRHPTDDQHNRPEDRNREQDPDHAAGEVDPEVAQPVGPAAHEPADQRDGHRQAHCGREEVLHGEPGHLHQVAHHRLGHVGLPVRVGDERHRGVERDAGLHRAPPEAERQGTLQPLQQVEEHDRDSGEAQHTGGVGGPALIGVGVHPNHPVDHPLDAQVGLCGVDPGHVVAKRLVDRDEDHEEEGNLQQTSGSVGHIRTSPAGPARSPGTRSAAVQAPGRRCSPRQSQPLQTTQCEPQHQEDPDKHQRIGQISHPRTPFSAGSYWLATVAAATWMVRPDATRWWRTSDPLMVLGQLLTLS